MIGLRCRALVLLFVFAAGCVNTAEEEHQVITGQSSNAQSSAPAAGQTGAVLPDKQPAVSPVLRQALIDVSIAQSGGDKSGPPDANVLEQVNSYLESLQQVAPSAMTLTVEQEHQLKAGNLLEGTEQRIANDLRFLLEYEIELPMVVADLVKQREDNQITAIESELLSRLLAVMVTKASKALSN